MNLRTFTTFRLALGQENLVMVLATALFVAFAITLPGFIAFDNLLALLQGVAVLGVLGIGMALVVIGRGIDLSSVAVMVVTAGFTFVRFSAGVPIESALLYSLGLAAAFGIVNGLLIAYVEIPAIFATLATGTFIVGLGQSLLVHSDMVYIDGDIKLLHVLSSGHVFGLPASVAALALFASLAALLLRFTRIGRYLYATGDNPAAARLTGVPTRPLAVCIYTLSALFAYAAGLLLATTAGNVDSRLAGSMMVYDVILVVVIGGIGLSGGKGHIGNVLAGTLMIGILLNGMTIMNLSYSLQNLIKSLVLLGAIVVDSILNPRDEQTAQQGDI